MNVVVVPIRSFTLGGARLAAHLDPEQRRALAEHMASRVADAAGAIPVVVVTSAPEVRAWAADRSFLVLDDPGTLNRAAAAGRDYARAHGAGRVVIAHADLPHAVSLSQLVRDGDQPVVAAVPCHRDDGTPVLSVPTAAPFEFAYGPGSFRRHAAEARRLGYGFRVIRDASLEFDVDLPADLDALIPTACP